MRTVSSRRAVAWQRLAARYLGGHQGGPGALPRTEVVGVKKKQFKVTIKKDAEDTTAWLVNVAGTPGAHSYGRSLAEAKRHALDVVALWFELEPEQFEIDWDVQLGKLALPVKRARQAMAHAEEDRRRRDEAVHALTEAGVSYRDIAELLGISHQRVAQIARAS